MAGKTIRKSDVRRIANAARKITKSKKSTPMKTLSLLAFAAIIIAGAWFNGYFDTVIWTNNLPIPTSPGFIEPAYVHGPEGGYEPTEWDGTVDRNYYRLAGDAVIEKDIAPGTIEYSNLDVLGRATGVYANLTSANYVPGKEREDSETGLPDPVGYRAVFCGEADAYQDKIIGPAIQLFNGDTYTGWGYNRSHLLADSLGGAPTLENLVTGTRMQNVGTNNVGRSGYGGMAFCEDIARNYLADHPSGTLYYAAVPVYIGEELLPRSVYVDMKSADGSVDMHVEVYNTMYGYDVDYMTGALSYRA